MDGIKGEYWGLGPWVQKNIVEWGPEEENLEFGS